MKRIPLRAVAFLAVLVAVSCGDAPTEPVVLIVAEHARAALDVSVPLPTLAGAETMDDPAFRAVLGDLDTWLDAAEARLANEAGPLPGLLALRADVERARALLSEAGRLNAAGERAAAVALLRAAESHLIRTTAFAVAEQSIAAAASAEAVCALRDAGPATAASEIAIDRGRRLLAHAREALLEGDFERALQRAHYAEILLAGECGRTKRAGR